MAKAVRLLCDDLLADVQTNEAGKATAIAMALTILQRHRLKERPAFMVNAAQAGSGKTTLVNMVAMAATGGRAAASAWSKDAEERRKALFSFFLSGHMFPLDMLPQPWQMLVEILPLQYLAYFPAAVFLGKVTGPDLATHLVIETAWIALFIAISHWLYRRGVKRYSGFGG